MRLETKHIGAYGGNPATIIELTVIGENATITENITDFSTNKVDQEFIDSLLELHVELTEHNSKLK